MALEISYWTGSDAATRSCYGTNVGRTSATLTGSSAALGVIPSGASVARLKAGENCIVSNNGAAASASNGVYLAAGDTIDIAVPASGPFNGMTA